MFHNHHLVENILLSGYLRDCQPILHVEIPNLVVSIISVYCKQCRIQKKGALQENQSNILDASICSKYEIFKVNPSCTRIRVFTLNLRSAYKYDCCTQIISQQIDNILKAGFINNDEVIDIQYSSKHALFLTLGGNVYAVGSNDSGRCGLGIDVDSVDIPTSIPFKLKIKSIACGELHSLFIDENGKLLVCGFNYCGQLGINSESTVPDKHMVSDTTPDLDHLESNSLLSPMSEDPFLFMDDSDDEITDDMDVYLDDNELAKCRCIYDPILNEYFNALNITFIHVECGAYHSLVITTNGDCYTFGQNGFGNLGNGQCTEWGNGTYIPYKLTINRKFVDASCGRNHNILTTENNEIVVFGDNSNNQCSMMNIDIIKDPLIVSKQKEFGILENVFVEKIICINDMSLSIIDEYKRYISGK